MCHQHPLLMSKGNLTPPSLLTNIFCPTRHAARHTCCPRLGCHIALAPGHPARDGAIELKSCGLGAARHCNHVSALDRYAVVWPIDASRGADCFVSRQVNEVHPPRLVIVVAAIHPDWLDGIG
jgi:hypothetical protein